MKQTIELTRPDTGEPKTALPHWIREIDRLLRGEATGLPALRQGVIGIPSDRLQLAIVLLGMGYGVCMGTYALLRGEPGALLQFMSGIIKVPALFLLTLLVTFPSLYVFNALVGSRLSLLALWRLLVSSVALITAVLASFGPIVAFFSLSTTSYSFMLLLNVLMFATAGLLGLKFLLQTLHRLTLSQPDSTGSPPVLAEPDVAAGALDKTEGHVLGRQVKLVFYCWVVVFALVGAQMSWVLRPFLGSPDRAFAFFRARESNFFEVVWEHILHLFN